MADVKPSGLPTDAGPTTDDELILTHQGPPKQTRRVTLLDMITLFSNNLTSAGFMTALAAATVSDQNRLYNGNFNIWQRNTTFTPNDDTYICDRWNALVETNGSWTFARDTAVPSSGSHYSLKATNVTLNNQCAFVQILEAKDSYPLVGHNVSFMMQAKTTGTEIAKLRVAILSWTGTEDTVTSDVISAWAQDGTEPTWAANWTREGSIMDATLTASFQRFTLENVAIDTASTKNVAVVIWVDDGTIAANDDFWITQAQLNIGTKALQFQPRSFTEELQLCQRYYAKSYPYATVPGSADGYTQQMPQMFADTAADTHGTVTWPTTMRVTPTLTMYAADAATGAGTAARARDNTVGGLETISATTHNEFGMSNFTTSTTFVAGRAYGYNYTVDAEL